MNRRTPPIPPLLLLLTLVAAPHAGARGDSPSATPAVAAPAGEHVRVEGLDEPIRNLRAHADLLTRTAPRRLDGPRLGERTASTTDSLLVPYFAVDRRTRSGLTTLFAVRNETARSLPVRILYLTNLEASPQTAEEITLAPHATHTVNLRDVDGLESDEDGVSRGLVVLGVIGGWKDDSDFLSGDFFFLNPGSGLSTGGALINVSQSDPQNEFCAGWGSRFFRGGALDAVTTFSFTVDVPAGRSVLDPPTVLGTAYAEDGTPVHSFQIKTDLHTFQLPASALVPENLPYGSLLLRFVNTEGVLLVEHSGAERITLGMRAVCRDRVPE